MASSKPYKDTAKDPNYSTKGFNAPVPDIPWFAVKHRTSPGAVTDRTPADKVPTLFKPLELRPLDLDNEHRAEASKTPIRPILRNRILVAPMCQYSSPAHGPSVGTLTPYHQMSLGQYAHRGASLVFVEATGVQPNGRITPNCPGLWSDSQIDGLKQVSDAIKAQGALSGIQLAHAGRKASTLPPWVAARFGGRSAKATEEMGGWPADVVGPSGGEDLTWDQSGGYWAPRGMSREEVKQFVEDWARAAQRAVRAGVQVVEIHAAHGYGLHQFLSPLTNRRTDEYGGSFENRTRVLREVVSAVRKVLPEEVPLFLRVSATEWMEESEEAKKLGGSWDLASTVKLAGMVADLGVDLLDVSSGGNHPKQRIDMFDSKDYQIRMADTIRKSLRAEGKGMLVGAVGFITEAEQAKGIVDGSTAREADKTSGSKDEAEAIRNITDDAQGSKEPLADVVLVARQFMREPHWVLKVAHQLGVDVGWPSQLLRVGFQGKL